MVAQARLAPSGIVQRMEMKSDDSTSIVEEGFSGQYRVQFQGSKRREIEPLTKEHLHESESWENIKKGVRVTFKVKSNKRGLVLGTLRVVVEEEKEEKIVVTDPPWTCPYPDCQKLNGSWKYNTECTSCKRKRPGKEAGRWKNAADVWILKPLVWECPKCKHRNPEFLSLSKCQKCHTPEPKGDGITTFWKQATRSLVLRFVSYTYVQIKLDSSEHTTIETVLERQPKKLVVENSCPLCEGAVHGSGKPMTMKQFYGLHTEDARGLYRRLQLETVLAMNPKCVCGLKALPVAERAIYFESPSTENARSLFNRKRETIVEALGEQGEDVLFEGESNEKSIPCFEMVTDVDKTMLCHIVPLMAGGCFKSVLNIVPIYRMCALCQWLDALFTLWQGEATQSFSHYVEKHDLEEFDKCFLSWVESKSAKMYKTKYIELATKVLNSK